MTRNSTRTRVPIAQIDTELARQWTASEKTGKRVTRVQTMTLVALCETPAHATAAERVLAAAGAKHGARTLLVVAHAGDKPSITADVALHMRDDRPVAEAIWLEATGEGRVWIPDTVAKLTRADLPSYAWWVGDLPDHDSLFHDVARHADLAIFDSGAMDLRDLAVLDVLARGPFTVADFGWQALRTWQELTARFFDEPQCRSDIGSIDELTLRFRQRAREPEIASNLAALFAGWIAGRLGWSAPQWEKDRGIARCTRKGGAVTLRFEPSNEGNVPEGVLLDVAIRATTAAGVARYRIARDAKDPQVVCWSGERPGVPLPEQSLRVQPRDEARLLDRVLERPLRDPLFETSLHSAAQLVADVAPPRPH